MTVYELTAEYRALEDALMAEAEENDGVISDELLTAISAASEQIDEKAENCAKAAKNLAAEADTVDGQIAALKAEIDRLTARRDGILKNADRIKARVVEMMRAVGKEKIRTPLFTLYPKTTVSVDIPDDAVVPIDYKKAVVKTEYKPDKKLIKEAIESGKSVTGATLIKKTTLMIK